MSRMSRDAYEQLIAEDLQWLEQQPPTLERAHIAAVLRRSPDHEYSEAHAADARKRADEASADRDYTRRRLALARAEVADLRRTLRGPLVRAAVRAQDWLDDVLASYPRGAR